MLDLRSNDQQRQHDREELWKYLGKIKSTSVGKIQDSSRSSDDDMRLIILKSFNALADVDT
jgi:hypothetical protein